MIDARGCEPRGLCDGYQAFGLLCAQGKVRAGLVRTADEDAEGHYALGDILATLARVAGVPLRFRLAFVARSEAVVEVCRVLQEQLRPFACELSVFQDERQAFEWLRGAKRAALTSATEAAAASPAARHTAAG